MNILIIPVVVGIVWGLGIVGMGLLLTPKKTLPLISRIGLSGVFYSREQGSAWPFWYWRLIGAAMAALGFFYGSVMLIDIARQL